MCEERRPHLPADRPPTIRLKNFVKKSGANFVI